MRWTWGSTSIQLMGGAECSWHDHRARLESHIFQSTGRVGVHPPFSHLLSWGVNRNDLTRSVEFAEERYSELSASIHTCLRGSLVWISVGRRW